MLGINLLFSIICHLQTNKQTKVVNKIVTTLLRAIMKKNLKMKNWEDYLPHVDFAYKVIHFTTKYSPIDIFYGFNSLAPIDLTSLPVQERSNLEGKKEAKFKQIHDKTEHNIYRII